jgi:hypothetical protein
MKENCFQLVIIAQLNILNILKKIVKNFSFCQNQNRENTMLRVKQVIMQSSNLYVIIPIWYYALDACKNITFIRILKYTVSIPIKHTIRRKGRLIGLVCRTNQYHQLNQSLFRKLPPTRLSTRMSIVHWLKPVKMVNLYGIKRVVRCSVLENWIMSGVLDYLTKVRKVKFSGRKSTTSQHDFIKLKWII